MAVMHLPPWATLDLRLDRRRGMFKAARPHGRRIVSRVSLFGPTGKAAMPGANG